MNELIEIITNNPYSIESHSATHSLFTLTSAQRLSHSSLKLFTPAFIALLFRIVEHTRDDHDDRYNYNLIKLIVTLNEQFMIHQLPPTTPSSHRGLPNPITPNVLHHNNLVLEQLKTSLGESKTFGENLIFILNRANNSPDSLAVSLLILKILYLLFTTTSTREYFYTNDLCVLLDVFIRELSDLGEESEQLKHTYLRVLHPLLQNTQLKTHPYKRPLLHRLLISLITPSPYTGLNSTTQRLVERCLGGEWARGMAEEGERNTRFRGRGSSSGIQGSKSEDDTLLAPDLDSPDHPSPAIREKGSRSLGYLLPNSQAGSSLSVDQIALADDAGVVRPFALADEVGVVRPIVLTSEGSSNSGKGNRNQILSERFVGEDVGGLKPPLSKGARPRSKSLFAPLSTARESPSSSPTGAETFIAETSEMFLSGNSSRIIAEAGGSVSSPFSTRSISVPFTTTTTTTTTFTTTPCTTSSGEDLIGGGGVAKQRRRRPPPPPPPPLSSSSSAGGGRVGVGGGESRPRTPLPSLSLPPPPPPPSSSSPSLLSPSNTFPPIVATSTLSPAEGVAISPVKKHHRRAPKPPPPPTPAVPERGNGK